MKARQFSIEPYRPGLLSDWTGAVDGARNSTFMHRREYMDYHAQKFTDCSLLVYLKGRPVAALPSHRVKRQVISHAGLTYAGLLYGEQLHAVDVIEILDRVREHYLEHGLTSMVYKAAPRFLHSQPADEDLYALHLAGGRVCRRDLTSVVDLRRPLRFSDSRKNVIRRAELSGLQVREGGSWGDFHELLTQTLNRVGVIPVHSLPELELLRDRFPNNLRFFGSYDGDKLLAGSLIYDFGRVVHTQYMASSEEGRKRGALDLILGELIRKRYSERDYFSFGISTEKDGLHLNTGLIFQKEGFGARGVVQDHYLWPLESGDAAQLTEQEADDE